MPKPTHYFKEQVLAIVKNIPRGKTLSYKEVAAKAGCPRASRVVGSIMKANYREDIPCHRVIRSDGTIGDYNRGGREQKITKLKREGVLS